MSKLKALFLPMRRAHFYRNTALFAIFVFIMIYASTFSRSIGFFSVLFNSGQLAEGGDLLSGGNRALRILWGLNSISAKPLGHGIAPFYNDLSIGHYVVDSDNYLSLTGNLTSTLSLPLDILLFGGIPAIVVVLLFAFVLYRRSLIALSNLCANKIVAFNNSYLFYAVSALISSFSVLFRYLFVANYWFPVLPFAVALIACIPLHIVYRKSETVLDPCVRDF